jgi:dTDP-4-dehydrorhamnose 3,5-epimerase
VSRLEVVDLLPAGLKLIRRAPLEDARGSLTRMFCAEELAAAGWSKCIAQINHTRTRVRGTVRGMHFQHPPHAEMKLVSCIRGEVWDVAVDVRAGSPTFLTWHAERLSAENGCALLIPEGFAHGFQSLSPDAEMLYFHSAFYAPDAEGGLNPRDPKLAIRWPLPVADLSMKDAQLPMLTEAFTGIA